MTVTGKPRIPCHGQRVTLDETQDPQRRRCRTCGATWTAVLEEGGSAVIGTRGEYSLAWTRTKEGK